MQIERMLLAIEKLLDFQQEGAHPLRIVDVKLRGKFCESIQVASRVYFTDFQRCGASAGRCPAASVRRTHSLGIAWNVHAGHFRKVCDCVCARRRVSA